ncbi:putative late blight resistance protein homolog R1B-16 [Salvia splendens]|uniref:putative late blight resistance protein homolog R1B-16 n=1 Tax=Salvia splendens TaxID=180675 RepID=UPI001C254A39|nr:putative late blight resistance protein homolog R1B-16 [Salvia splendens]
MAYNLQSLITILQQILHPEQTHWTFDHNKPQLESLLQKAESLMQILEKSSHTQIASFESQIRDTVFKTEDLIESQMVHQMLSHLESESLTFSTPDLHQVTQELDSAVVLMAEKRTSSSDLQQATQQLEPMKLVEELEENSAYSSRSKNDLVGVDAILLELKVCLTNMERKVEIIPIVGMGGIGKSTLARNLYDDACIVSHFDYRGWAAISQVPNVREIMLSLLRGQDEKVGDQLIGCGEYELREILHKRLFGRRYMIVLDDIWSTKVWDEIRMYFPDNSNGSRIVITTRESDAAFYVAGSKSLHHVRLLNKSASRDLLCRIAFGEEVCPGELQGVAARIGSDCSGLPLAIHVIGGLLSKVERSRDVWENVSTDVKASIVESDEHFSNILYLSYNHLPIHLKPCFLYMGAFPEDYEIKGSRLKSLWIAEGFVKSKGDKSLEEEAEDYLKALVERNLLLVRRKKYNGKPVSYSIHDLLRDLCLRKANEEKFLNLKDSMHRVSVHSSSEIEDVCASPQLMSFARSFICTGKKIASPVFSMLRLVRVLDVMGIEYKEFPKEILQLINLRYLAFSCTSGLPIGISRLWNLQTLICRQGMMLSLPFEIWEMSELRRLRLVMLIEIGEEYRFKYVHKKLYKIYFVRITPSMIRNGFFETIPNIISLGIHFEDIEVDLSHLHKLEILRCHTNLNKDACCFLHKLRFPCNIRKLVLNECAVAQSFLTTLCALPNLEVLKIRSCMFERDREAEEEEWEMAEGDEFRSLQFLRLSSLNIERWKANETNYPNLQVLYVIDCKELEEIPCDIGDIPTLQTILVYKCGSSVVASAQDIHKVQQEEYGNYDLKVLIPY